MGCGRVHTEGYGSVGVDTVGIAFGCRRIETEDGAYNLLVAAVRRTPGNQEWVGNFAMGNLEENLQHAGFAAAARYAMGHLEAYIAAGNGLDPALKTKVLLIGHSRGGAVANLVATALADTGAVGGMSLRQEDVYTYTFATPNLALDAPGTEDTYGNIFNIVNGDDLIPRLPLAAWGAGRYGKTLTLPREREGPMKARFEALYGFPFRGYESSGTVPALEEKLNAIAPDVEDYTQFHNFPLCEDAFSVTARLVEFFAEHGTLTSFAHAPETYIAWMDSLPEDWAEAEQER